MYEVEVKAKLRDREEFVKKLENFGCKFGAVLHQTDRVYFPEGLVFPPPIGTAILRVRKQNDKYFFTLKISQSGRQDSLEREMEIKDGGMMIEIIKLLKYQEAPVVDKKRIKTKLRDMEIVLDDVEDLGEFIEVEKIVTNENPKDRQKIQIELCEFLETLGVAKADLLVNGKYDIMLFEKQQNK
jgi:adenylate cyclase class 2